MSYSVRRGAWKLGLPAILSSAAAGLMLQAAPVAQATQIAHGFSPTLKWVQTLPDSGNPIALSSPNVANLDGQPAVVVGDRVGYVWAFHLSGGSAVGGWPFYAGAPVDSSPSVAPIDANGTDSVYVGSGNAADPMAGGYQAIAPNGGNQWFVPETNPPTDVGDPHSAVSASLTVGAYAGGYGVEGGSLGQYTYALTAAGGAMMAGFPWFSADS